MSDLEKNVVEDFGNEWKFYNQSHLNKNELQTLFYKYFHIFPFEKINSKSEGFDMGCGTGRWAKFIAPTVKTLNCIDPSIDALNVAKKNLKPYKNCNFLNESVFDFSLKDNSQDFGYSLGVLHHTNDANNGLKNCVKKLKREPLFLFICIIDLIINLFGLGLFGKLLIFLEKLFLKCLLN